MGHFDRYWEMQIGGPRDEAEKAFKCKDCGAESYPDEGWNGEPDVRQCHARCSSRASDWRPGRVSRRFRENFARIEFAPKGRAASAGEDLDPAAAAKRNYAANFDSIFPGAPGAGM